MKELFIFAGANGSGKTAFYLNQIKNKNFYATRVDPNGLGWEFGKKEYAKTKNERMALKLRKKYLASGISFNIETTLSGRGVIRFINQAHNAGYKITLFYLGLRSLEIVRQRIIKNTHVIDDKTIQRRFSRSFENIAKILPLCDKAYFYDNSLMITDLYYMNLTPFAQKDGSRIFLENNIEFGWFDAVLKKIEKFVKIYKPI